MNYRAQAARLRSLGFGVSLGKKGVESTPARRAAVARLSKKVDRLERDHVAVKGTPAQVRRYGVSGQKTRKAIFVPVPFGVSQKDFKAKFEKDGTLRTKYRERTEIVLPIDPVKLATGGARYVANLAKRYGKDGDFARVTVNGYDSKRSFDVGLSEEYMVNLFSGFKGTAEQFKQTFRLKIVRENLNDEEDEEDEDF